MTEREHFEAWEKPHPQEIEVQCPVCGHTFYEWPNDQQQHTEAITEWNRRAQPAQASDLVARCREILSWKVTGLLTGNALRSFAKAKWGDDHMALSLAEADTMKEALEVVVAQPAQAGQVLTHRELLEEWTNTTLEPCTHQEAFVRGARWAEQAVLAKRVPMTDDELRRLWAKHAPVMGGVLDFARDIERHHGIVGEEGGV